MVYTEFKRWIENIWQKKFVPFFRQFFAVLEVVFYITLPTIILFLFAIIDNTESVKGAMNNCYANGEFLLYSIALLSSAYTTMKVYRNQNTSLIIILIILVSILYAVTIKTVNTTLDKFALFWVSVIASIISLLYTWHAMSLKNGKQKPAYEQDEDASKEIEKGLKF